MTEQCWALIGGYDNDHHAWRVCLRQQISGQPASVEADWKWALVQEEDFGNLAGFAHTHPSGAGTNASARDIRTMQAWCSALGKPLLCIIGEGQDLAEPVAYVFEDDQSDGRLTSAFEILDP
jgi:hypothetical protein